MLLLLCLLFLTFYNLLQRKNKNIFANVEAYSKNSKKTPVDLWNFMQSNLFNHSVWYLQLSKDLGYSPPRASHSCISFRQGITDLVLREGGSGGDAGWVLSSVCSVRAVAMGWSIPALGLSSRSLSQRGCSSLWRDQGNKRPSSQSHHPPGRPWSRFTGSAHPNSLWKELPRHWETSSCV